MSAETPTSARGAAAAGTKVPGRLRRLLREPMLHFALVGVTLFLVHAWVAPNGATGRRIVVDRGVVEDLAKQYEATWQRPPTARELAGLVETYVHDEVLYREGLAMGLDRDDPLVKRRVRQKVEMLAEDDPSAHEPSEAELSAFLARHAAQFTRPAVYSFRQIYLGEVATREEAERLATAARAELARGRSPAAIARPSLLADQVTAEAADQVARDFGDTFAGELATARPGAWSGPLRSSYGAHLVRVTAVQPASVPPLQEVRTDVAREWARDRRERSVRERYAALRAGYDVVIETGRPTGTL